MLQFIRYIIPSTNTLNFAQHPVKRHPRFTFLPRPTKWLAWSILYSLYNTDYICFGDNLSLTAYQWWHSFRMEILRWRNFFVYKKSYWRKSDEPKSVKNVWSNHRYIFLQIIPIKTDILHWIFEVHFRGVWYTVCILHRVSCIRKTFVSCFSSIF